MATKDEPMKLDKRRGILKSEALKKYILERSAYPREHEQLTALRESTAEQFPNLSVMMVPADEAQLLSMLLKLMNAKKTLEIGVFTGYSLLATALALPPDAQITAIDINKEYYEFGLPFIQKAGMSHKINFIEADAMTVLNNLNTTHEGNHEGELDFIFIDADKTCYKKYHETVRALVKVGGVIAYDNTLWQGFLVEEDEDQVPQQAREARTALLDFNTFLLSDSSMEISLLSIGDGLTLCRRIN